MSQGCDSDRLSATHTDEHHYPRHIAPDLQNPNDTAVTEALTRKCDQCHAPAGQLCVKRVGFGADLAGRLIHIGRRMKP